MSAAAVESNAGPTGADHPEDVGEHSRAPDNAATARAKAAAGV